ncbi:MAG: 50S ribosomal protein L15 [Planctomycetota bacterium]
MNLQDVRRIKVKRQKRHRVGRGQGSGWGTTSGRGHKGAGQRSGNTIRLHFEGGQMPIYRRLPKKGFTNAAFKLRYHAVNVGDLDRRFEAGSTVDLDALKHVGLAPKKAKYLKILGWGEMSHRLLVRAHAVSEGARKKIEAASGSIELLETRPAPRPKGVKKTRTPADGSEERGPS